VVIQLIISTLTLTMANFHRCGHSTENTPSEEAVQGIIAAAEDIIAVGLGFSENLAEYLDFEKLETRFSGAVRYIEEDALLRAVAGVVAEVGPWNASMDMVARRSGLSKSGLYAHFESKQDMLGQLFLTEFDRIINFAEASKKGSDLPEEQLYLGIISIADYLRSRPEILVACDWLRTRRIDPGKKSPPPPRIYRAFADLKFQGECRAQALSGFGGEWIPQWILFSIVNTLMQRPAGVDFSGVQNSSFRTLYRFICLGVKGFKK
jgi:AcrR family transcriptional regulator